MKNPSARLGSRFLDGLPESEDPVLIQRSIQDRYGCEKEKPAAILANKLRQSPHGPSSWGVVDLIKLSTNAIKSQTRENILYTRSICSIQAKEIKEPQRHSAATSSGYRNRLNCLKRLARSMS